MLEPLDAEPSAKNMPETGREAAELLQRADPNARARAAQRLRYEDFGAELSRALQDNVFDPDPEIRSLAVGLIPDLREPVSPELLSSALHDSCPDVAISAAEAFAILRFPRASDILSECLALRPQLAGPLALALARLEESGAEELLVDRLGQGDPAIRIAVLRALGACGTARSMPQLVGLLGCGDPVVEGEALAALVRVRERSPSAVGRDEMPSDLVAERLPELMTSQDRHRLLTGIALIGWLRPPEGPALLLGLLESPDRVVRERAREAFGAVAAGAERAALESVAEFADRHPAAAAAALDRVAVAREVDPERLFGRARGAPARAAALRACDPRRAGAQFRSATSDPDSQVRLAAAMSLNEHGVWLEEAAALLADEDPRVRAHALHARLKASPALGLEPLAAFLRDRDEGVRQTFAIGLERATGVERGVWLRRLLGDPSAAVGR